MDSETPATDQDNVNKGGGDFVGRDKTIHGDAVHGDKVTGDRITVGDISHSIGVAIGTGSSASVTIQQPPSEAELRDQNNRHTLRQMVKKFWIEGVLEHSLNHEAALQLNLGDRSNLVENRPWKLLPQQVGETVRLLPQETHILDVFDQMNQRLLILGEPGAGKTTLLLELARALLQRADATPGYPSPVIFNLSSWIERKAPLAEWLVDELRTRYTIPKKLAQAWVTQDKLLPLLDGLDEVQSAQRAACAEAINQFHAEHLVPLVVCSRVTEYENLTVRLKLQGAVLLQPLTPEQIDAYLNRVGPTLATVRSALHQDTELQELAQSPLLLNIMTLAYQGVAPAELNLTDVTQTRRQHLFDAYIQRMLFAHREVEHTYSPVQTVRWLKWLAIRLEPYGQTPFLIERMQPDWMQTNRQKPSRLPLIMLLAGPLYGLIVGLLSGLIFGLFIGVSNWLNGTWLVRLNEKMIAGLLIELIAGLIVGLIFGLNDRLSGKFKKINPIEQSGMLWRSLKSSLYATLFWGLFVGLSVGLFSVLVSGLISGWLVGLISGLISGLCGGLLGIFREIEPAKHLSWSWQRIKSNLIFGLIVGLLSGLIVGLLSRLGGGSLVDLISRLHEGLIVGLSVGLSGGLIGGLILQPSTRTDIQTQENTQTPNQGIWLFARHSLVTGLIFGLLFGLLFGLPSGLLIWIGGDGLLIGISGVLTFGLPAGLMGGMIGGLIGGGDVVMKHCILRFILWSQRHIPWNYARFLDYATALIFLRKVGGGYIFVHRLVMEHFAGLDEKEIERIAKSSNFR